MIDSFLDGIQSRFQTKGPSPKDEEKEADYYAEAYPQLTPKEIATIREIVRKNVEKSAAFGHIIPPELALREEVFCLVFLNKIGGASGVQNSNWDNLIQLFWEAKNQSFGQESRDFFEQYVKEPGTTGNSRNWYDVHWVALRFDLLNTFNFSHT